MRWTSPFKNGRKKTEKPDKLFPVWRPHVRAKRLHLPWEYKYYIIWVLWTCLTVVCFSLVAASGDAQVQRAPDMGHSAVVSAWHLVSLLVGLWSGQTLLGSDRSTQSIDLAIEEAAALSSERCALACAPKQEDCSLVLEGKNSFTLKLALSFGFGWLATIVGICYWCCCQSRRVSNSIPPSEDLSPSSLAERRLLAQSQLAQVRARRHGISQ